MVDCRAHDIELHSSFEAQRVDVRGGAVQLQQIVMNVVRNAIDVVDHTQELRLVMVGVRRVTRMRSSQ